MAEIALALAIVYGVTFVLARFFRIGTVVGITLGSVLVAYFRIIPQSGPTADAVDLLGTIGLLVSMFLAGNGFDTKGALKKVSAWILVGGQMVAMTVAGAILGKVMGSASWLGALVIGFTLMQSSTNIVVDAIKKRNWTDEPVGILGMTLMVVQDVASGLLPLCIGLLVGQQGQGISLPWLGGLLALFAFVYKLGPRIEKTMLAVDEAPEQTPFILGLALVLIVWLISGKSGISAASAAFVAGLCWRQTRYVNKTESQLGLARDLLTPLFFISALRIADLSLSNLFSGRTLVFSFFDLIISIIVAYPLARMAGIGPMGSGLLSIASAQIGEFTFFIVFLTTRLGILTGAEGGALAFASVITFLISAMAAERFEPIFKAVQGLLSRFDKGLTAVQEKIQEGEKPSVIFLDVPEGTNDDIKSAIMPWVKKASTEWRDAPVMVVESVGSNEEEVFLRSLDVKVLVREPYLDPVSILKNIGFENVRVVVSGPALGLRQDLDLIRFLVNNHPKVHFITVASNRIEADDLESVAKENSQIIVVNETRDLAKNLGSAAEMV